MREADFSGGFENQGENLDRNATKYMAKRFDDIAQMLKDKFSDINRFPSPSVGDDGELVTANDIAQGNKERLMTIIANVPVDERELFLEAVYELHEPNDANKLLAEAYFDEYDRQHKAVN